MNSVTINLPKNFELYRGTKRMMADNYTRPTPVYFLFGNNGYGIANRAYASGFNENVFTFKTSKPLKLLRMDTERGLNKLKKTLNKDEIDILERRFKYDPEIDEVRRHSAARKDKMIAGYVCRAGYDGYYAGKMPQLKYRTKDLFHQEIVLCNAKDKVEPVVTRIANQGSPKTPRTPRTPGSPMNLNQYGGMFRLMNSPPMTPPRGRRLF